MRICYDISGDYMKSVGIICEYNPFHNGHLHHLNEVKKKFSNYPIVLVMSGNFTERGDASLYNKWDKTKIALQMGVDLVVELPFVFATQSADTFAKASIEILNHLKVNYLVFGSESNDINKLDQLADIQLNHKNYHKLVKDYLDQGINYPTALSKSLYEITGIKMNQPNDILGITYIREIKKQKANITPITIKRNNDYNGFDLEDNITSATSIRHALKNNSDISRYVPEQSISFLNQPLHFMDQYFSILKYKILTEKEQIQKYQTVDEGIEHRICKYITTCKNLDELILKIKTKRYTYNKLNRMFTHILCNFTKKEANEFQHIKYIRTLGFSFIGKEYLNSIKKEIEIPIIGNYSKLKDDMLEIEFRATCVYASILKEPDKTKLIEAEYKNYPIMIG